MPSNLQDEINCDEKLQSMTDGGDKYYIVFHSNGEVETEVRDEGKTVTIKFNETNLQDTNVKQYTYYLTTKKEHEFLNVLVINRTF